MSSSEPFKILGLCVALTAPALATLGIAMPLAGLRSLPERFAPRLSVEPIRPANAEPTPVRRTTQSDLTATPDATPKPDVTTRTAGTTAVRQLAPKAEQAKSAEIPEDSTLLTSLLETTPEISPHPERCEGVYVYIVSDWGNGDGMATLSVAKKGRGYPKRVGARVGKYRVAAIGPSANGFGPAVWLNDGETLCQASLFDDNPQRKRRVRRKAKKRKKKKRRRKRR